MSDTPTTIERLRAGLMRLGEQVPTVMQDPREHPREAMLLAVGAALAVLLVVILSMLLWDTAVTAVRRRRMGLRRTRIALLVPLLVALGTCVLVLALAAGSPSWAATSKWCGSCHETAEATVAWSSDSHANAGCFACHADPGPIGGVAATFAGLARSVDPVSYRADTTGSSVHDAGCLRCHATLAEAVVGEQVLMRHKDVIDAGYPCVQCHPAVGHGGLREPTEIQDAASRMDLCLACHDGATAPASCPTCHVDGPIDSAEPGDIERQRPTLIHCDGCHSARVEARCVDCHGLVLPHPAEFASVHAARALREPALCRSCHEELVSGGDSCACHPDGATHGPYQDWLPRHGGAASSTGGGGCNCHQDRFCEFCHVSGTPR